MRSWKSLSVNLATLAARLSTTAGVLIANGIAARAMSHEQFGLWVILLSLNTLTNGFDLGYQFTLGNRLAALVSRGAEAEEERRETFLSVIMLQALIFVLYSVIVLLVFRYVPWAAWFKIQNPVLAAQTVRMMPPAFIIMMGTLPVGLIWTVFFAYREIKFASLLSAVCNMVQIVVFAAAVHWCGFESMVLIYFAVNVVQGLILTLYVFARRKWSLAPPSLTRATAIIRSMSRVSMHAFFHGIAAIIGTILGPIVSGAVGGLVVAGDFTLIQKLFSFILTAHLSLMAPVAPVVTQESQSGDWDAVRRRLRLWVYKVWPLFFVVVGTAVWLGHPFLIHIWAGRSLTDYRLAAWLLLWACLSGLCNTFSVFLNSLGLMKIQAVLSFSLLLPSIVLPVILGRWIGLDGIAIAWIITSIPFLVILPIYTSRALRLRLIRV